MNEQQDDWYDLLPMAEFQHNNYVHSTTQQTLFLLDTRRLPHMGFEPRQNSSGLETVNEFMERMRTAIVRDVRSGSGVTPEWKRVDNEGEGTTLASARALCLDRLSRVWLHISGGLNCCQESRRGVV